MVSGGNCSPVMAQEF